MAAKTKIKISDDMELRKVLDDEYENSSQIKLCRYALLLAEHILKTIDYHDADSLAIKAGFAINESWQKGNARMHHVRQAGFQIHRLAKSSQDMVIRMALRAVEQAVAAGHAREHAMVSSDYADRVINLLFPNDMAAVRRERMWPVERLKSIEDPVILRILLCRRSSVKRVSS